MKSIRKAWAATAGEAEEEGTRLLAGGSRVQSLWVQPVPRECEQGVPVAVEAERDTGADEGHPLLAALANKRSHADRQVRRAERTGTPSAHQTERLRTWTSEERPWLPAVMGSRGAPSHQLQPFYLVPFSLWCPAHHLGLLHPHRLPEAQPWSWRPPRPATSHSAHRTNPKSGTPSLSKDHPALQPITNET